MSFEDITYASAIAGILGTIVAVIALIISPEFRYFVGMLVQRGFFWRGVGIFILLISGIALGAYLRALFPSQSLLEEIIDRGYLICGVEGTLPYFSVTEGSQETNSKGHLGFKNANGFDADYCRVIATAIFGDSYSNNSVFFVPLETDNRFEAVEMGEVDVLLRTTTWTVGRDLTYNVAFGPTIFYDGQGFWTKDSSITTLEQMNGKTICVQKDTTTHTNLEAEFRNRNIFVTMRAEKSNGDPIRSNGDLISEFRYCDVVTADKSQLLAMRSQEGGDILVETISKEPLAPVYKAGDEQWANVVDYAIYATIEAAEMGISTPISSTWKTTNDFRVKQFLGLSDEQIKVYIGEQLGLQANFASLIIERFGNYDQIYSKHFENLISDRGPNTTYLAGGLLYSPPFLVEIK